MYLMATLVNPLRIWGPSCWNQVKKSIHKNTWGPFGKKQKQKRRMTEEMITKNAVLSAKENGGSSELFSVLPLFIEKYAFQELAKGTPRPQ